MERPLEGRIALVTGASSGIGAATARELARRGATVILTARRAHELDAQVRSIAAEDGTAMAIAADLSNHAQVAQLARQAAAAFGRIDILVANAGIGDTHAFAASPAVEIERVIAVNLSGLIMLVRAILPGMLERRRGAIIAVASIAGHIPVNPVYSATKFGVRGFMRALRRQVAGSGVTVSVVSPGYIRTAMTRGVRLPMPGPARVATAIADLALDGRREVLVPRYYTPLPWLEFFAPGLLDRAIALRARLRRRRR